MAFGRRIRLLWLKLAVASCPECANDGCNCWFKDEEFATWICGLTEGFMEGSLGTTECAAAGGRTWLLECCGICIRGCKVDCRVAENWLWAKELRGTADIWPSCTLGIKPVWTFWGRVCAVGCWLCCPSCNGICAGWPGGCRMFGLCNCKINE